MHWQTVVMIKRRGKEIFFFLKEGEFLSLENIVDVEIHNQNQNGSQE